jgi:hypothetical protein
MSLAAAVRFLVPAALVAKTEHALREAGAEGYERFVLWTGELGNETFAVRHAHVPAQEAYKLPDGLCVQVDGPVLHELNVWLYEHGEMLGVQVHSHPDRAYHSATDDGFPIVTMVGGASLVIPNFGEAPLFSAGYATYRLTRQGWTASRPGLFVVV